MVVPRPDPPPDRYMITYILAYTHSTTHACIHTLEPCRPLFVSSCSCVGVWRGFGVWHGLTQAWLVPKQGPTRPGSVSLPTDLTRRRRRLRIVAVIESIRTRPIFGSSLRRLCHGRIGCGVDCVCALAWTGSNAGVHWQIRLRSRLRHCHGRLVANATWRT